ncbi:Hpt domain-containing protein [Methylopila sp. M107]|uniref:Hpt domain-containing protein n=1 Tax=Methylopila sp. M107 TaxID=1101190 RepID=UPI0003648660|nr:Hpt domain-containing protein [Methylopila sp. M107]
MTDPESTERQRAQARVAEIRSRFVAGLDDRLAELSELARSTGGPDGKDAWDRLRLGLHNLSGAAPTLGLADLGRGAGEIEEIAIGRRRPDGGLSADDAGHVAELVLALGSRAGSR